MSDDVCLMQIISDKDKLVQKNTAIQALYLEKMKIAQLRNTHVRQALFDVMLESDKPLTIQSLVNQSKGSHFVSIYRSVDAMHRANILKLVPQGFKNAFELSDTFRPHHHHATCEKCGKTVELHEPELEELMISITKKSGLTPTKHHFELFGLCEDCDKA